MGRRLKNPGLYMAGFVQRETAEENRPLKGGVFLALLLYLEAFLSACCIATVAGAKVQYGILAAGILISTAFIVLPHFQQGLWQIGSLTLYVLLVGVFAWKGRQEIADGFLQVGNRIIAMINEYYQTNIWSFRTRQGMAADATYFFIAAIQPLLFIYAQPLFENRMGSLALLFMGVSAFGGLALGCVPQELAFAGMIICMIAMAAVKTVPKGKKGWLSEQIWKQRGQAAAMAGGILLILFLAVFSIVSHSLYQEKLYALEMKEFILQTYDKIGKSSIVKEITNFIETKSRIESSSQTSAEKGGVNGGYFNRSEGIRFSDTTDLSVVLPDIGQPVYLKGYNGTIYTNEGWQAASSQQMQPYIRISAQYSVYAQDMPFQFLRTIVLGQYLKKNVPLSSQLQMQENKAKPFLYQGEMTVNYKAATKKYIFGPYFWDSAEMESLTYEQDGYVLPKQRKDSYTMEFYMLDLKQQNYSRLLDYALRENKEDKAYREYVKKYLEFNEAYVEYVNDIYTLVPKEHEKLNKLAQTIAAPYDTTVEKLKKLSKFLSGYEYTLMPGAMPEGEDFVEYFLFTNKKGYCVHFASAAVLLLRSLGVPARYAEGYYIPASSIKSAKAAGKTLLTTIFEDGTSLVNAVDEKTVEVKDYCAHAWIEVYMDTVAGWIPFEVTTGFAPVIEEHLEDDLDVILLPTDIPVLDEKESIIIPPPSPSLSIDRTEQNTNWKNMDNQKQQKSEKQWYHRLLEGILAVIFILGCRYAAVMIYRKRKKSRKRQVLWYYSRMERYLKKEKLQQSSNESYAAFADRVQLKSELAPENFAACQELALRAGFSKEGISKEEAEWIYDAYMQMRKRYIKYGGWLRAAYLKFVKLV